MHFLPQPCRSHSGYAPILCAGFAYPNEDALSISEKADSYCKSVYRSFFFFFLLMLPGLMKDLFCVFLPLQMH